MISPSPLRVLVVEDDPSLGRALTRSLALAGYSLCALKTCGAARELRQQFDCAVLDIDLPDGKGVELAGELLTQGFVRLVVFFTASSEQGLLRRATGLGPVVAKSCGVDELINTLNSRAAAEELPAACENRVRVAYN